MTLVLGQGPCQRAWLRTQAATCRASGDAPPHVAIPVPPRCLSGPPLDAPCDEHVPLRWALKLSQPSVQIAVAPAASAEACESTGGAVGGGTVGVRAGVARGVAIGVAVVVAVA